MNPMKGRKGVFRALGLVLSVLMVALLAAGTAEARNGRGPKAFRGQGNAFGRFDFRGNGNAFGRFRLDGFGSRASNGFDFVPGRSHAHFHTAAEGRHFQTHETLRNLHTNVHTDLDAARLRGDIGLDGQTRLHDDAHLRLGNEHLRVHDEVETSHDLRHRGLSGGALFFDSDLGF